MKKLPTGSTGSSCGYVEKMKGALRSLSFLPHTHSTTNFLMLIENFDPKPKYVPAKSVILLPDIFAS